MPHAAAPTNDAVVRRLIDLIRRKGLRAGDRLPSIRVLSARMGVSPNIVRDALLRAQTLGLLKIHPRSGAFVRSLDFSSFVDALSGTLETALIEQDPSLFHLTEARQLVECELADAAALRHRAEDLLPLRDALQAMSRHDEDRAVFIADDERFHLSIARMAANPVFVVILRALLVLLRPYRTTLVPTREARMRTERLHEAIYRRIMERDAKGAREAMRDHLMRQRPHVQNLIRP